MNIVLATRNKKKVEEIKRIVAGMPISLYTLNDFPDCPEVEEDGKTFEDNAAKKAKAVSDYTNMPALADDSGLEVYALNGAPGVLSARYAGEAADDRKNFEKLLNEMRSVPDEKRGARFACCIALVFPVGDSSESTRTETLRYGKVETFMGYSKGSIGREPKGSNGFGYDPVFYPAGCKRTFAEMDDAEKDSLSHRGAALKKLHEYLKSRNS
ncbi:MAG: XTP/dITP diphosphatase [Thermodesulfovibrionales bacterium]|nr:XTP/dITP diphosphatase [Thermodesulfovibrionales bacterium]